MTQVPSLVALRCFDLSARHCSFTKAAREIHLTQGAVSHQILGLEAQLGASLFIRRKAGLELTDAGRSYWVEISSALRQLERATQNLVLNKGKGGTLNMCVASSFATYWLMPRLADFVSAHPEVTLNISTHIGPVDFATSPHDAAIEYCDGAEQGLCAELILPLELQPYCSPALLGAMRAAKSKAQRVAPAQLRELLKTKPLIRHTTVPMAWECWLKQAGLTEDIQAEQLSAGPKYDLLSMALNGAIAGLGIALLPGYLAAGPAAARQIASLSPLSWKTGKGYYLRFPEWKSELIALRKFQHWICAIGSGQQAHGARAAAASAALF